MRDFIKKFWFKPYPYTLQGKFTNRPVLGRLSILGILLLGAIPLFLAIPAWIVLCLLAEKDNDLTAVYQEFGRGWLALLSPWNPQ